MEQSKTETITLLLADAQRIYNEKLKMPIDSHRFTDNKEIDDELCDIEKRPYMFVLACVMDRQINAERAWSIPHFVCEGLKASTFAELAALPEDEIVNFFMKENIHRFDETMGHCFYDAVQRIQNVYNGDVSNIWAGKPSSAAVVYQFLCFKGVGIKIATMAANILHRDFHVEFSDLSAIDVSPDVQVCRILYRLGLTDNTSRDAVIYKAKEINPSFPGLIDLVCWRYGRDFCHPTNPECTNCPLNDVCCKQGI